MVGLLGPGLPEAGASDRARGGISGVSRAKSFKNTRSYALQSGQPSPERIDPNQKLGVQSQKCCHFGS